MFLSPILRLFFLRWPLQIAIKVWSERHLVFDMIIGKMRRLDPILVFATWGRIGCVFGGRWQEVLVGGSVPPLPTLQILEMYHVTPVERMLNLPPTTSGFSDILLLLFIFVYF